MSSITVKDTENLLRLKLSDFTFKTFKQVSFQIYKSLLETTFKDLENKIKYENTKNTMHLFYRNFNFADIYISREIIIPKEKYKIKKIKIQLFENDFDKDIKSIFPFIDKEIENGRKQQYSEFYRDAKIIKNLLANNNLSLETFDKIVQKYNNINSNEYFKNKLKIFIENKKQDANTEEANQKD